MIELKVNASSLNHYKSLGYAVSTNEIIKVKAEDLSHSSNMKVKVICDYCDLEIEKTYSKYIKQRKIVSKDACISCFPKKQKEVCQEKYGIDSTLQLKEVKDKAIKTLLSNYGVENPMHSSEIKGRFVSTMVERYGVEYAQQSDRIREKTIQTYIENYGVSHPIYVQEIRDKMNNFEFINGVKVSYIQKFLAEYLNGALNLNIEGYFYDIALIKKRVIIEYNGSGHDLSVKLGKISREDFNIKEKERLDVLNQENWGCIVVNNPTEKRLSKDFMGKLITKVNKIKHTNKLYYLDVS